MAFLVLLRHGESEWNKQNRFTGFKDVGLSENGEQEAIRAGEQLSHITFDKVFSSTLKRANDTAQIALARSGSNERLREGDGYAMTCHDDLRERDYGDLTGLNKDETREKYGDEQVHIWRRSYDVRPPGGECLKDVVDRVRPYYEEHIKPLIDEGKNVLLAAHGNTLRAMLIILEENTPENISQAEIPTGVPLVFEFDGGQKGKSYYLQDDLIVG